MSHVLLVSFMPLKILPDFIIEERKQICYIFCNFAFDFYVEVTYFLLLLIVYVVPVLLACHFVPPLSGRWEVWFGNA